MKYRNIPHSFILALLLSVTCLISVAQAAATDKTDSTSSKLALIAETEAKDGQGFVYRLEGRPDPFAPFISEKSATQKPGADEIIDEEIVLTGMRKFEPGQLTLVAILSSGGKWLAMVEDVTGRGYVLSEGMPIGRRGVVSRIDNEQVTVLEVAHTRAGRRLESQTVMRLNKEGDQ